MTSVLADSPSLGLYLGVPAAIVIALVGFAVVAYNVLERGYDWEVFACIGVAVLVIDIGVTLFAMYPFGHDYHYWVDKTGVVSRSSSRLISAGDNGGSNQRFVLVVNGQPLGVDDTRAALVKPGDRVHLRCKKEFEWGTPREANGWGCKWAGIVR